MYLRSPGYIERTAVDSRTSCYDSSYNNPAHHYDINRPMNDRARSPPPKKAREPFILSNVETLRNFKKPIDFTMFWKPKDINRTRPDDVQKPFVSKPDEKKEQVRRTRPRIRMFSGINLDDIEDPQVRDSLIQTIYMSSATESDLEVITPPPAVKAPMPDLPAPPMPIKLPVLKVPTVPKEWRMESLQWDRKQLRGLYEVDKFFWNKRNLQCQKCEESAEVNKFRKMGRLP